MKPLLLGAILVSGTLAVSAQSDYSPTRANQAAEQLKRSTTRLAEAAVQDLLRSQVSSRTEIQHAMLAQEMDGGATILLELTRIRRSGADVREAAALLTELSRRMPASTSQPGLWRTVQNDIGAMNRMLNVNTPGSPNERPIVGRVSWRGMVDDRVQLVIRGKTVETRVMSGNALSDGVANFTTPLPTVAVEVDVNKLGGRGTVRVLQHPARANEFTAVIEIYDAPSGAQEYRLDIVWR
jgi:hypothetical protein